MDQVIPWTDLVQAVRPHSFDNEVGRPVRDLLLMLKIYFLQQWFNLGDPTVEDEIYDCISFQQFLDIDLMREAVPDETTVCKFRHLLEQHKLQEQFLGIVNALLEQKGYLMKKGTIVDATLIAAPSSTKNKDKKRDPEMHQPWHVEECGNDAGLSGDDLFPVAEMDCPLHQLQRVAYGNGTQAHCDLYAPFSSLRGALLFYKGATETASG